MMGQDEYRNEDPKPACRIFETGLAAFLEGEQRPEVLAHASECDSCGAVLGDLQQVITTSGLLGYQDPPARLWTNLRVALVSEGLLQDSVGFWQSWAAALTVFRHPAPVAAVACLALLRCSTEALPGIVLFLPQRSHWQSLDNLYGDSLAAAARSKA